VSVRERSEIEGIGITTSLQHHLLSGTVNVSCSTRGIIELSNNCVNVPLYDGLF
jgi:hypothetical protein